MVSWRNRSEHPSHRLIQTLRNQGIRDERVLDALQQVPRERFVSHCSLAEAWENHALPIGHGQTISQPYVVAAMTEALALQGHETILEIGTGSGYQSAVLSRLAATVTSIERIPQLAQAARTILAELGCDNVTVIVADGSEGWAELAPYDGIIVTAGAPETPPALLAQLSPDGGKLVIPVGPERNQVLVCIVRNGDAYDETSLGSVAFVPLIGTSGWPERALDRWHSYDDV